jgi:threonine synthase
MVLDETRNPTASYKDRGMTVAVSKAVEQGAKKTVTASSGNAAAALAAYSAAAGLQCVTFVEEVTTVGKLAQLSLYGANVIRVAGLESGEDPAVKMLRAACDNYHLYPCPSMGPFNPYQIEGPKTMSYEIVEQSGWTVPDWVFVPAGGGSGIGGNWKGYEDFTQLGFISSVPKMVVVQSTGCAPIVRAYERNMDPLRIVPWERPDSVATGLMDPYPWDGDLALHAIKKSHGQAIAVSNEEILHAQQQLAKYAGIFAEPSGATSLAGAINLLTAGRIDKSDHVVVEITGSGLKDPEIVMKSMPNIPLIKPSLEELRTVIKN